MKWSDLINLVNGYEYALYSDAYNETRYGCDCGCGGDSYTSDSWDEMCTAAAEGIVDAKEFCKKNGFEYDGVDYG